jgi:hypothetical protein
MFSTLYIVSILIVVLAGSVHIVWPRFVIRRSNLDAASNLRHLLFTRVICYRVVVVSSVVGFIGALITDNSNAALFSQALFNAVIAVVHIWTANLTVRFVKEADGYASKAVAINT